VGQLTQFNFTPHPVLLDGQRIVHCQLLPGESLYAFLQRHVERLDGQQWHVSIGGHDVQRHLWHNVRPKDGQVIELRGALGDNVLQLVAIAVLSYFTLGAGSAWIGTTFGVSAGVASAIGAGLFIAGSMLINSVLGPKIPNIGRQEQDSVYSIGAARNTARPNEPFGIVFGEVRSTPDYISAPYTYYMGNDQYVVMTMTPGLNCQQIGDLYNGDTLLSSFDGVDVWYSGFPGMPEQAIPLYSNVDTTDGGALDDANVWVERTTSLGTMSVMLNYSYVLFDTTTKGKPKNNQEDITAQYRPTGSTTWLALATTHVVSKEQTEQRKTVEFTFPSVGQYDIRVKRNGNDTDGKGAHIQMSWTTLNSVQPDTTDYTGIPRIGLRIKATGQLNGYPDEIRGVVKSEPIDVWTTAGWVTATERSQGLSNPGAQLLAYARGLYMQTSAGQVRYSGLGLTDDMIDMDALKAFMLHCTANGFTYDYIVKDAKSHDDVCNTIALAGMGQISWAGGKFSVVWAADDQPISGVVNMATIKKASFNVDYSLVSAADGIEYSYFDRLTWETKTVIVRAPGVTVALNPAKVSGEGVSDADHAAKMARYHLGQSLYQFKSIGFNTDLEHLTYRRMSVLQLAHDMTQWGYGGRLVGATINAGTVTLQLDEPVPPPASGNAWIGVRVLGETVYRVLAVQPFAAETNQITLAEPWPSDADFPGEDFPAHDSIWIYDFKQTPGYRVRVVNIEPESDLKGARISVVPESDEFWTYVLTGEYTPPTQGTSLNVRPVVSNVRVSEQNNVQGNTVYTTLSVTFDVDGDMQYAAVLTQDNASPTDELVEVAQTQTRTASFRIPGPGTYAIVVRPYDRNGIVGGAASIVYTTVNAQPAPILFDTFAISEDPSGIRRYSWGYAGDTIQSPDLLGAEIRYTAGDVALPNWDTMQPLGDGYHTGPFESVLPSAGQWTFAIRARNTSGVLSPDMLILVQTLQYNLAQKLEEVDTAVAQEIIDRFNADAAAADALAAEAQARADALVALAEQAAADATAKANAARDAAIAHADVIGAQVADITGADEWATGVTYPAGDLVKRNGTLYRALQETTDNPPESSPTYWEAIGNYSSLGEAVAASIDMGNTNASDIETESTRLDGVVARMPTGTGTLATSASVTQEATTRANADSALSSRTGVIEARLPTGTDTLANEARVVTAENASVSRDDAISSRVTVVEARMPAGTGQLATSASVTDLQTSTANADSALSSQITAANSRIDGKADSSALNALSSTVTQQGNTITSQGNAITQVKSSIAPNANVISNSGVEADLTDWELGWDSANVRSTLVRDRNGPAYPRGSHNLSVNWPANSVAAGSNAFLVINSTRKTPTFGISRVCLQTIYNLAEGSMAFGVDFFDSSGAFISGPNETVGSTGAGWTTVFRFYAVPENAATMRAWFRGHVTTASSSERVLWIAHPMLSAATADQTVPPAYSPGMIGIDGKYASATQSLNTRVTTVEGTVTSQSSSITSLQNTVANKADSSVVSALDSRVTSAENTNTSQSSSITSLQNTVANKADSSALNALSSTVTQQGNTITSQGNAITQVKSSIAPNANVISNSGVESDLTDWELGWDSANVGSTLVRDRNGFAYPYGSHNLSVIWPANSVAAGANAYLLINSTKKTPTFGISRVCIQTIYALTEGSMGFGVDFFDSSGAFISGPNETVGSTGVDWTTVFRFFAVPANAATMRAWFRGFVNTASSSVRTFLIAHPMLSAATQDQTVAPVYSPGALGLDSKYASVTQSLTTRATNSENNIASVLAQYFLSVQAGNLIGGMKIGNNGSVVDFAILANIFRIVDPSNSANLLSYINGNLTVSGIVEGSLLKSSAMELGSTRIHTGSGRLAPFTINDSAFNLLASNAVSSQTVTVSGFVGPANGSGYNAKRFSRQRMDVYLKTLIAADDGNEELYIEVQYDGGGWSTIQSYPFDGNNRTTIQISIRYTTLDSWSTVAFRARTTLAHTNMLSLDVEINNTNESGNAAGSKSGLNAGEGAGGTPPPPGGGDFCVDYETTVLPDGRYVRDLQAGDIVECVNVVTGDRAMVPLRAMNFGFEDCYTVRTEHGEVIQSRTTPMDMRDGSIKCTPELQGQELLTHDHGWEVADIEYLGERKVCKPDFGDRMFFAGTHADRTIATHNIQYKP
jgi:uncharacterized coiled-coil protein SlyX